MRFINTLRKRGLALLLAVLMCLSMMPTGALAAELDDFTDEELLELDWSESTFSRDQKSPKRNDNNRSAPRELDPIHVGETSSRITGSGEYGYSHLWMVTEDSEEIASVTAVIGDILGTKYTTNLATVTGSNEGTATIIHTWETGSRFFPTKHEEIFVIKVIPKDPPDIDVPPLTAHLWVTNQKVHVKNEYNPEDETGPTTKEITKKEVSSEGTPVEDLAPDGYTKPIGGKNCCFVFWKAVVHDQLNSQQPEKDDQSRTGTEITSIRYDEDTFQYSENNGENWDDFTDSDVLDFYYRGETDLTTSTTISVVDWWGDKEGNPTKITYQAMDYLTDKPIGDSYTTHYNDHFSETTIWATADKEGFFEVVAVTKNVPLDENDKKDLSACTKNIYNPDGITFSVQPSERTTIYIYVRAVKGDLTVEYRDASTNDEIPNVAPTLLSVQASSNQVFTDDMLESDKLKADAHITNYHGDIQYIPSSLPTGITGYNPDHVRAEIADNGKTLKLYFQKSSYSVTYSWAGLPEDATLYDEYGNTTTPTLPAKVENLNYNDSHNVDSQYDGKVVYTLANGCPTAKYTFDGWYNEAGDKVSGDNISVTENITLTGNWDVDNDVSNLSATVTFEIEGGNWIGSPSTQQTIALRSPADTGAFSANGSATVNALASEAKTDDGYQSNGTWYIKEDDGTYSPVTPTGDKFTITGDTTYKYVYPLRTYTVTATIDNDGTVAFSEPANGSTNVENGKSVSVDHNGSVTVTFAPAEGYHITGVTKTVGDTFVSLDISTDGSYTVTGIMADTSIAATTEQNAGYTVRYYKSTTQDGDDVPMPGTSVTWGTNDSDNTINYDKYSSEKLTLEKIEITTPSTTEGGKPTVEYYFPNASTGILDTASLPKTVSNGAIVALYFEPDKIGGTTENPGDGIPDKYQATVTYRLDDAAHGTLQKDSTSTTEPIVNLVTLTGNDGKWTTSKETSVNSLAPAPAVNDTTDDNFAFDRWVGQDNAPDLYNTKAIINGGDDLTYIATFEADSMNKDTPNSESGDNIPDKYQVKVIYAPGNNGTFADGAATSKVVTLTDESGAYLSQKGVTISTTFGPVPEVTANSGWAFDVWSSGDAKNLPEVVTDYAPSLTADNTTVYGGSTITFTATYDVDEKKATDSISGDPGDGIPDKYQSTATYKIENGTWSDGGTNDKSETITLSRYNALTNSWEAITTPTAPKFHAPTGMIAGTDRVSTGSWNIDPSTKPADEDTDKREYTFTYTFGQYTATVNFVSGLNGSVNSNNPQKIVIKDSNNDVVERAEMDLSSYAPTPKPDDGYMFEYWAENGEKVDLTKQTLKDNATKTFTAVFTEDRFNENGTSGGDNIADKYQIKVVFNWDTLKGADNSIPNNTFSKVITLKGENGSNATSETLTLNQKLTVPNITGKGVWDFAGWTSDKDVPLDRSATIEGGTTITYTANFTPNDNRKVIITVKAASLTAEYDGTEKSVAANSFEAVTASDGKTYTVTGLTTSGASGTDVSDSKTIAVSGNDNAVVKNATGATVSPDAYTLVIKDGALTITPRPITLTSGSDSKTYDGSALTNDTVRVTSGSWAEGENATYTVTGRQTNIGSSDNAFTLTFNEGTKKENYTITLVYGTLTVRSAGSPPTQEEEEEEEEPRRPVIINNGGGGGTGDTGNNGSNTLTDINDLQTPLADMGLNTTDHYAYLAGFSDGTIRPLANITRAEVATIFFRLMSDNYRTASWATTNSFPDVKAGEWYTTAISTVANASLMSGDSSGNFRPNDPITRGEFASIASRLAGNDVTPSGSFSDVSGHWAKDAIELAAGAGWIQGSNGQFRPNAYITRAEAATIVNAMVERKPHKDHLLESMTAWPDNPSTEWYYAAIQEATNTHDFHFGAEGEEASAATADYESWTSLGQPRDWSALMTQWAQAASQPQQAAEAPAGGQLPDAAAGDQQ